MHRQAYIPPGAGKNFISLYVLWEGDRSKILKYQEQVNEFQVLGQHSTLWDYTQLRSPSVEGAIKEFEAKNPKVVNLLKPFRSRVKKEWFLETAEKFGESPQGLHVLERDWYWLPIMDFSIFYVLFFGKNKELDYVINQLCDYPWSSHNIAKKELTSIIHYSPNNTLGMSQVKNEIKTLRISFKDSEEYISDLLYAKHSIPSQHERNNADTVAEERFYIKDTSTTIVDEVISYRKIFMEQNKAELERLFGFFGKEEYFDKNTETIIQDFQEYHKTNKTMVRNFDFSNVPGYEKSFFKGWKDKHASVEHVANLEKHDKEFGTNWKAKHDASKI